MRKPLKGLSRGCKVVFGHALYAGKSQGLRELRETEANALIFPETVVQRCIGSLRDRAVASASPSAGIVRICRTLGTPNEAGDVKGLASDLAAARAGYLAEGKRSFAADADRCR